MMEGGSRSSKRWIIIAVSALCVSAAIVVLVLVTNSDMSKNRQKAIDLVRQHLDESNSKYDQGMFETWEASGDRNMMEVSATYYPQGEESELEGHSRDVLHVMKWQVNLKTGTVIFKESLDPDG